MLDTIHSISVSKSNSKESKAHTNYESLDALPLGAIAEIICNRTWSPHIWTHGYRAGKNWQSASFIALDFDSGFPLLEAQKICENESLTFLIGTTKSHQIAKTSATGVVSPPVDRYRLLIFTVGPIDSAETYRNTLDELALYLPFDESCKDLARYFFPCQKIMALGLGQLRPWLPLTDSQRQARRERKERHDARLKEMRGSGLVPSWIMALIRKEDYIVGTRHRTCFRIGAEMEKLGFDGSYIEQLILTAPGLIAIGREDALRAARNGIRTARGYWGESES